MDKERRKEYAGNYSFSLYDSLNVKKRVNTYPMCVFLGRKKQARYRKTGEPLGSRLRPHREACCSLVIHGQYPIESGRGLTN